MAEILGIFKIIGFVILGIFALILFLLIMIFHVPARYSARVKINNKDISVSYGFSWFLHLLYLTGTHGEKGHKAKLRVLGIPVKTYCSKKAAESETEAEKTDKPEANVKDKIGNILNKGLSFKEKYDHAGGAYNKILNEVICLLKKYKPKKAFGYLDFGFADPALTGAVLGLYYAVYPVSPEDFRVTGNFEEAEFDCDFNIKGQMHVRTLAASLLRLYRDKEVVKLFKDREKKHGRK